MGEKLDVHRHLNIGHAREPGLLNIALNINVPNLLLKLSTKTCKLQTSAFNKTLFFLPSTFIKEHKKKATTNREYIHNNPTFN